MFELSDEQKKTQNLCSQIKQLLKQNKPLTGEALELALGLVGEDNFANKGEPSTADKLKSGQQLNEYEFHLIVDVFLLHIRLGQGEPINSQTFATK